MPVAAVVCHSGDDGEVGTHLMSAAADVALANKPAAVIFELSVTFASLQERTYALRSSTCRMRGNVHDPSSTSLRIRRPWSTPTVNELWANTAASRPKASAPPPRAACDNSLLFSMSLRGSNPSSQSIRSSLAVAFSDSTVTSHEVQLENSPAITPTAQDDTDSAMAGTANTSVEI